ncbi:MAG TPA: hypothetical protein VHA12_01190 [Candidatus Nanoarchaeia archaeon]|nr:hypothetical protein [Candidatus Nanoarchaeia archaeon]
MAKHCIYCKTGIPAEAVLDVCERCGHGVWGAKMYETIKKNMQDANSSGNLMQGSITQKFDR